MLPLEEGELPEEPLVASRREGEGEVAAVGAEGAELIVGQGKEDQRQPSDQGLEKLERAKGLLLEGGAAANIDDVKKLLKQSSAAFSEEHNRSLSGAAAAAAAAGGERGGVVDPWRGAPLAATICIASELAFPEAIALVRCFCSQYVANLCEVARVAEVEAKKLEKEGKHSRKARSSTSTSNNSGDKGQQGNGSGNSTAAGAGAGAGAGRAVRVLRVLITAFNAFLRHCSRGRGYTKPSHVHVLDIAVSLTRKVMERLAAECSTDPAAGPAAARLRGLTATACFAPPPELDDAAGVAGGEEEEPQPNLDNLKRLGNRDVEKLLVCISGGKAKRDVQYLRLPGSCIEAIGALRSVAAAAPQVYHTVAEAFTAALKCVTMGGTGAGPEGQREGGGEGEGDGEREWGGRPALKNAAVRHTLFACSAHLADGLGRSPDAGCHGAHGKLVSALEVCYVMWGSAANGPHPSLEAAGPDGAKAGTSVAIVGGDEVAAAGSSVPKRSKTHPAARAKDKDSPGTTAAQKETAGRAAAVATPAAAPAATAASAALPPPRAKEAEAPARAAAPAMTDRPERSGAHAAKAVEVSRTQPTMGRGNGSGGGGGGFKRKRPCSSPSGLGRKRPRSPSPREEEAKGKVGRANRVTRDPARLPARPTPLPPSESVPDISIAAIDSPRESSAAALLPTTGIVPSSPWPLPSSATAFIANRTAAAGKGAAPEEGPVAPPSAPSAERPPPPSPSLLLPPLLSTTTTHHTSRASDSPAAAPGFGGGQKLALMAELFGEGNADEYKAEEPPADLFGEENADESSADEPPPEAAKVAAAAASLAAQVAALAVDAGYPNPEQRVASPLTPPIGQAPAAPGAAAIPATATATGATKGTGTRPTATKSYPPLKSAPEKKPEWREGDRYEVVLGDSFYAGDSSGGGGGSGGGGEGPSRQEQYVHLKYDFVPSRTNLDAPATLRQRPLTAAEGRWKDGRGGSGSSGGSGAAGRQQQQERWAAELDYESRDPSNSEPVRFSGDATRAQGVECVLVFDGKQFVMDHVSIVGGLKNIQGFTVQEARGAAAPTPEATMAKKKKDIKDMKSMKEKEEKKKAKAAEREEKKKAKAAEKAVEVAAKAAARAAERKAKGAAKAAARAAAKEEKALAKAAAKLAAAKAKAAATTASAASAAVAAAAGTANSSPRQQRNGGGGRGGGSGEGDATGNILA